MDSTFSQSYRPVQNPVDSESDSSDSDSSDDVWKRKSSRKRVMPQSPVKTEETKPVLATDDSASSLVKKRKLNTVWSNVLQEQSVADDLVQFGLKSKPVSCQDRSCESYDFRLSSSDPRRSKPSAMEGDFSDSNVPDDLQLGERPSENSEQKNGSHGWWSKSPRESREVVDKVAKRIIRVLNEPKHYIIYRVVKVLGSQKALELLEQTEEIEDNGGMRVMDNSRRRTPGGTFFQLLKKDSSVSNKKRSIIFAEDRRVLPSGKLHGSASKNSKKKKKKKTKKSMESMDIVCETSDTKDKSENAEQNDSSSSASGSDLRGTEIADGCNGTHVQDAEDGGNGKSEAQVIQDVFVKEDSELEEGEITD